MRDDLASEPVLDHLTGLSPIGMDQAQLLFEAGQAVGRASARPSRGWLWLTMVLGLGHAGWIVCWLSWQPSQPARLPNETPPSLPTSRSNWPGTGVIESREPTPISASAYIKLYQAFQTTDDLAPLRTECTAAEESFKPLIAGRRNFELD